MKFLLFLLLALKLFATPASGVYVEVNVDNPDSTDLTVDNAQYNYDKSLSGTLAIGYQMQRWRFEVESNYSKNDLSETQSYDNIRKVGGLANVYYSAYNHTKMVSTIGIGVGATDIQTSNDTQTQELLNSPALTYQANVSLGYMVSEDWTWTIKYKYTDIKDVETQNKNFSLGLRYLF